MKRVKMPLYMRMQNFLYLPGGEIFWTSASLSIPQKIKRWWNKDKSKMCNTSRGFTLPWHGQMLRYIPRFLVRDWHGYSEYYDIDTGKLVNKVKADLYDYSKIKGYCPSKNVQGLSFKDGKFDYAYFGNRGKDTMYIIDVESGMIKHHILYDDIKKKRWHSFLWASYEAEGLQYGLDGELEVGISVKTWFGAILNYTHKA